MSTYKCTKLQVQEVCNIFPAMPRKRKSAPKKQHPADQVEVGGRIKDLLKALGWDAVKLASLVKITPQKLNNYTSGRNKLPPTTAAAICACTGADFDYLHRGRIDRLSRDLQDAIIKARKEAA